MTSPLDGTPDDARAAVTDSVESAAVTDSLEGAAVTPAEGDSPARQSLLAVAKQSPALSLGPVDILFLTALHLRAEHAAIAAFSEGELLDVFREVLALAEPSAENLRKRATHAFARLREQRLVVRVDGAGVMRAGQYTLTRLGTAIVEFYLTEEALTGESLSLLTEGLIGTLGDVLAAARTAEDPDALRKTVVGPLRVTVSDLAEGIARRQRALDSKQEDFQRRVAALLQADWFGALESCESLLEGTSRALRELNEVLLRDTHRLHEVLHELRELAREAAVAEAESAVERVAAQVDRIAEWGAARQRAWSDYHQYVHRFLRDVVRLDPTRALSERLRSQLANPSGRGFALTVAHEPAIVLLREDTKLPERPPVRRERKPREAEPQPEPAEDPEAVLESLVRRALDDGARGLAEVTRRVAEELPEEERYVAAGRVAEIVARVARAERHNERPWLPVADAFVIEEWPVSPDTPVERESVERAEYGGGEP
jgi:chromosome partition protein MukF